MPGFGGGLGGDQAHGSACPPAESTMSRGGATPFSDKGRKLGSTPGSERAPPASSCCGGRGKSDNEHEVVSPQGVSQAQNGSSAGARASTPSAETEARRAQMRDAAMARQGGTGMQPGG